jgi:hypothetical protein
MVRRDNKENKQKDTEMEAVLRIIIDDVTQEERFIGPVQDQEGWRVAASDEMDCSSWEILREDPIFETRQECLDYMAEAWASHVWFPVWLV